MAGPVARLDGRVVARVRERALASASGDRFRSGRGSDRALRVRGMRSARRGRDAKRVSALRRRGRIVGAKNDAEARSASFAEVREARGEARVVKIAVRGQSVRSVLVVRERADLHRGRRSRFVRVAKARDLRRGHPSRFVLGARADRLSHGRRKHFVHVARENVKGLRRDRRSRFGDGMRAVQVQGRSGRFVRENETIEVRLAVKESQAPSEWGSRGLQGRRASAGIRNLAERRSSAVSASLAVSARRVERAGLRASRNPGRETGTFEQRI